MGISGYTGNLQYPEIRLYTTTKTNGRWVDEDR